MSIQYDEKQTESFALGSSVYGGRPTFVLVRDEDGNDVTLTLYELLPTEQADARRRRLERHRQQPSKMAAFDEIIDDADCIKDWTWDDWVAMKVRRLSGARLRSVLQLLEETLQKNDLNSSNITRTGDETLFLREETGIRVSLAFIGVKPLRRIDRMRRIAQGVSGMSMEECYYWYSKCQSPNTPNGAKALRVLLSDN